jgi:hypothetical protein
VGWRKTAPSLGLARSGRRWSTPSDPSMITQEAAAVWGRSHDLLPGSAADQENADSSEE